MDNIKTIEQLSEFSSHLTPENIENYLCNNTYFKLSMSQHDEFLGDFSDNSRVLSLECEAIIYLEDQQLLVAVNHYFKEDSDDVITFDRNDVYLRHFQLSFSNELIGMKTKSSILFNDQVVNAKLDNGKNLYEYIQDEETIPIFTELHPDPIQNKSLRSEDQSFLC